jgi:endonuclease/exonuclease/phosphatase family metal-dependent hydrolase
MFLCFISTVISPAIFWIPAYFGLFFQFVFVINIVFLTVWTVKKRQIFIVMHLVALVPSIFFAKYFIQIFGPGNSVSDGVENIKLLSYNIQGFLIPYQKNTTHKNIVDFINSENPDIVCLQEFYVNEKHTEGTFCQLMNKYEYHAVCYSVTKKNTLYGVATFSHYPIKSKLEIPFEGSTNAAMYTDININGKLLRVYNVHFQSIRLNMKKLFSGKNSRIEEIEEVSSRLKTAFIKRAGQVDMVAKHIDVSPYPVVICGDFNDMPVSYSYRKIKKNRKDTFCEAGRGMPSTYRLSPIPSFRIDYILHDRVINSIKYSVYNSIDFSDHYPVSSIIDISSVRAKD